MSRAAAVLAPPKRLLTRAEAAAYCGVSLPIFESVCPVRPVALGEGRRLERFDVVGLDGWIDRLKLPGSAPKTKEQALAEFDDDEHGPSQRH